MKRFIVFNIYRSKTLGGVYAKNKSAAMRIANNLFGYDSFNRASEVVQRDGAWVVAQ